MTVVRIAWNASKNLSIALEALPTVHFSKNRSASGKPATGRILITFSTYNSTVPFPCLNKKKLKAPHPEKKAKTKRENLLDRLGAPKSNKENSKA